MPESPASFPDRSSDAVLNGDPGVLAVDRAILELRRGRIVAVASEDEGGGRWLLAAAVETATPALIAQLQASGGELALAVTAERARSLGLPCDATGLPTLLALGEGASADDIVELGQDWESRSRWDAVRATVTHAEICNRASAAALLLAKRAQLLPILLVVSVTAGPDPARVLRVSAADIERFEVPEPDDLLRVSEARVPLEGAEQSRFVLFRDLRDASEHVAVVIGEPDVATPVPVRVHSSCLTGDLLGSLRCDCGEQLRTAVTRLVEAGGGVLLYLAQEGRGIGLANKLRAYHLQDAGLDTIDANEHLGFSSDERQYAIAAGMLRALGIRRIRLLTNSPQKVQALRESGIAVDAIGPLPGTENPHNARYIRTKRDRAGHGVAAGGED